MQELSLRPARPSGNDGNGHDGNGLPRDRRPLDPIVARQWALRIMEHSTNADGIWYPSRHDDTRRNLALFQRPKLLPARLESALIPPTSSQAACAGRAAWRCAVGRARWFPAPTHRPQ